MPQHVLKYQCSIPKAKNPLLVENKVNEIRQYAEEYLRRMAGPKATGHRYKMRVQERTARSRKTGVIMVMIDILVGLEYDGPISPEVAPLKLWRDATISAQRGPRN